jgi:ubiquinone/menaquinone biosynthesis C-methylase UbiE
VRSSPASRFDRWAPGYDDSALQQAYSRAHRALLASAAHRGKRPNRILDVGCGTGRLLAEAAQTFPQADMVGVDPSAGMLSVAAAQTPAACRLVQARAEDLPFPDDLFDLVTATYSIRHWSDSDGALRQIARVLAPHGLFGLVDAFPRPHPARRWRYRSGAAGLLPPATARTLHSAGLRLTGVAAISGFGAITHMTVAFAVSRDTHAHQPHRDRVRRSS